MKKTAYKFGPVVFITLISFFAVVSVSAATPVPPSSLATEARSTEELQGMKGLDERDNGATFSASAEKPGKKKLFSANKPEMSGDPVWDSIKQKNIDAEGKLALAGLIDIALKNAPATSEAWNNINVAAAQKQQAESAFYPQVALSGRIQGEDTVSNVAANKLRNNFVSPSAKITYLLFDFGGTAAQVDNTLHKLAAADAQYNQALQDLVLNVEVAYYTLYGAQAAYEAAKADVANNKANYDAAKEKFDAGLAVELDVFQAKTNYENALYEQENAKYNVKSGKANLAKTIGVSADAAFDIAAPLEEISVKVLEEEVSSAIEEAIKARPDVVSFRENLKAAEALKRAAFAGFFPTINLTGTGGKTWAQYYTPYKRHVGDTDLTGYVSVDWNIFSGFNDVAVSKQADAEAKIAMDQLIDAELGASADVWIKYFSFNAAVQKFALGKSQYETASVSYNLAKESYDAGLKTILDLLQAQSGLSTARKQFIQSRQDVFTSLAGLAHSIGSPNARIAVAK
ncbi:MAG: TolC family protein [Candidatus Omnitrophica bacterium]|nr:TolC family protein [Candidatus Omnitrophota bacterium]